MGVPRSPTGLSAKFGQPFVIENRGGAGGITGAAQVARTPVWTRRFRAH
jgi:tripartite-type tricarboxylate transporter receptor subunit TctC